MASGSKIVDAAFTSSGVLCDAIKFSWEENSQSVENNSTVVGWKLELIAYKYGYIDSSANKNWSVTVNGEKYSGTNKVGISANSTKTLASGTTTITHNSDGTKSFSYSFSQELKINFTSAYVGTISGSGSGTLTAIGRASQPSLITYPENTQDVGYFGDTISVHMNRKSSSFTHKVRYAFGSLSGTCIDADTGKEATAVTNGFRWTIPMSLMNAIPNNREGSGRIYVETYNGSTKIGTEKYSGFTVKMPNNSETIPTLTTPVCEDTTSTYSTYGSFVQGLSKIKVTATATEAYSSPIVTKSISIDGKTYNSLTATTGLLVNSGKISVIAEVEDARERGNTKTKTIDVLPYSKPSISKLTVHRCNSDGSANDQGDCIKVVFSASITNLSGNNNQNDVSYTLKYKKTTDNDTKWTLIPDIASEYTVTDASYVFKADADYSYDVSVEAEDSHHTTTRTTSASTAFTLIDFKASGTGIAFGKLSEKNKAFECAFDMYDKYGTVVGNGRASYTGSGDGAIDPDTTTDHLILTNTKTPTSGTWFFIKTEFYNTKTATSNRFQMAFPYSSTSVGVHMRVYYNGAWSAWASL